MYVVKEGEVDIFINDFHLETVSSDGIFGELSLIDQETRIASAIARTDCTLQLVANSRDKAVLHLRDEDKFFLLVNAHEQRVEAVRAEDVTANDELLLQVRKKLDPRA